MDNKKFLTIIIVATIIITIIGGTLAYWNWRSSSTEDTNITLTVSSTFSCSADGGGNITNTNYFVPTDCTNTTYALKRTITTSIINNSGNDVYMDLWLNINSIGTGLSNSENFKYALTTNSSSCTTDIVSQGTFQDKQANDKVQLLNGVTSGSTYYLYIWLDAAENSSSTMNQSVSLSLGGECTNEEQIPNVPNFITDNAVSDNINSTYVSNATPGIDFTKIASDTNGKGIYIISGTENNENPIYYYRGAVDNNNVYFGGFCWKIVRTTDTGGIKMIYNGTPTSGSCGSGTTSQDTSSSQIGNIKYSLVYNSAKYAGYTYDKNGVETNSTIKSAVDTWYQNNLLTNYDFYIEDTIFCNDRSTHAYSEFTSAEQSAFSMGSSWTINGSTYRLAKKTGPSVICPNSADAYTKSSSLGNGKLTYPIGLLTSDEVWMAGEGAYYYGTSGTGYNNTTYYLQNNSSWWTMSPSVWTGSNARVLLASSTSGIRHFNVDNAYSVRPVISLKPSQKFGYGNETVNNPYRFVSSVS